MSLINEALKRARTDAERQAEAERGGTAPAPAWTPPPFSRKERSPVVISLLASLGVSLAVAFGLYFFLHRDAETRNAAPAPAAVRAAPAAPAPQPTSPPTAATTAPVSAPAPTPNAPPVRHTAATSGGALETAAAVEPAPSPARAATTADQPARAPERPAATAPRATEREKVAPAKGPAASGREGRTVTAEVTLPSGAKVTLDGIISGAIPLAMLNGHMIGIGEFAGDCAVMKIAARRVQLRCPSGLIWIALP